MKKIEKIFSDVGRELNRISPFKWDKVSMDVFYDEEGNDINCYFINQKRDKIKFIKGSEKLSECFEKYHSEVLKNEGKSLKTMTVILSNSGHVDLEFSFETVEIMKTEERIEELYSLEKIKQK